MLLELQATPAQAVGLWTGWLQPLVVCVGEQSEAQVGGWIVRSEKVQN